MKISIRTRLTIWYISTISFILIAFSIYTYLHFSHTIFDSDVIDQFDSELIKITANIGRQVSLHNGPFYSNIEKYMDSFNRWVGKDLFLSSAYGQLRDFPKSNIDKPVMLIKNSDLGKKTIPLSPKAYSSILKNEMYVETIINIFPYPIRIVTHSVRDLNNQKYILQYGMSMRHINTTLSTVLFRFLIVWPVVLILISVIGYLFIKKSFLPVKQIVETVKNITAEDLTLRIGKIESKDEIGDLIDTFNSMIDRLQNSFEQVKQFSDNVSHELKTPLTIFKGEIEVALRKERSQNEYIAILESLLEEAGKYESIIENLLVLSRIDSTGKTYSFREINLNRVIMEAYEETIPLASRKDIIFSLNRLDEIIIQGNDGLLKRLFVNLMVNAVKYTEPAGRIDLELIKRKSILESEELFTAEFIITDTGMGIPGDDLPHVFKRFYRVEKSRSPRTGGVGLGLTIVKKIMELHKGKIRITSTVNKGTSFLLFFQIISKK